MTIHEGEPRIAVAYDSWAQWRAEQCFLPEAPPAPFGSCFCAICWGAGRLLEPAMNGEGLVPQPCPTCCGTGSVPSMGRI